MCREDEREGTDFGENPHPLARKGIGMPGGHTRVGCYHVRYGVVFVARAHAWKRRQSRAKGFGMIADDTPTRALNRVFIRQTRAHSFGRGFQKYPERSQTPALRPAPAAAALTQEKSPGLGLDLLYMIRGHSMSLATRVSSALYGERYGFLRCNAAMADQRMDVKKQAVACVRGPRLEYNDILV
jgi:hypothetical protein